MSPIKLLLSFTLLSFTACREKSPVSPLKQVSISGIASSPVPAKRQNSGSKAIHVFVALCDNKYQGIVPAPAAIGNGQDPKNNLYWGAGYGVKAYFINKSSEWKLVFSRLHPSENILERILFKHISKDIYLLADAYDGKSIAQTTTDFLNAAAGRNIIEERQDTSGIFFGGAADLIAYVGHDGLMDFSLKQKSKGDRGKKRETIILACYSKRFFSPHLQQTGASPLLWTTGLMAPEAYTLHDAILAWANNDSPDEVRRVASKAYSKYQKCSLKAASNLLVHGW